MLHQHLLTSFQLPCIVEFVKKVLSLPSCSFVYCVLTLVFLSNSRRPESCESGVVGSTPDSHSGDREFKSRLSLAQMAEW